MAEAARWIMACSPQSLAYITLRPDRLHGLFPRGPACRNLVPGAHASDSVRLIWLDLPAAWMLRLCEGRDLHGNFLPTEPKDDEPQRAEPRPRRPDGTEPRPEVGTARQHAGRPAAAGRSQPGAARQAAAARRALPRGGCRAAPAEGRRRGGGREARARLAGKLRGAVDPGRADVDPLVDGDQVGAIARRDPPELAVEPEELRRIGARHPRGPLERQTEEVDAIANRARHVERRTRERAVLVHASAVRDRDATAGQKERILVRADGRHRVGDEHAAIGTLGAQCDLQHGRMHVHSIDDEAAPALGVVQRGPDGAGLAMSERRHPVEEVRYAAHALADCRAHFLAGSIRATV